MTQSADLWTAWTSRRDEGAFEALVRPELPHALGFARRLGCSAADADDALQDALARLATVRDDAPAAIGVRAWLFREVHTRARSRLRSDRRRLLREAAAARPDAGGAGDAAEVRDEVERALAGLEEDERIAVELRHLHDLDYREMARVLGVSEGACRQRVHKALAALRARFGRDAPALVAALPLPAVPDGATLVRSALAKSAAVTATKGAAAMTTAQKVTAAAALAAVLGVTGTLAVQRAAAPAAPAQTADARDAEIARLRAELEDARSRATSSNPDRARTAGVAARGIAVPADAAAPGEIATVGTSVTVVRPRPAGTAQTPDPLDVMKRSAPWQAALRQSADPARRDGAWAEVRGALAGTDAVAVRAALQATWATRDVRVDRTGVRELLVPLLDTEDADLELTAWAALIANGIAPDDVQRLRARTLAAPMAIRPELVHRLNWATKGVLEGADAEIVLRVFEESGNRLDVVMAIQQARISDALAAKVVEFARSDPEMVQLVERPVLRAIPDKSRDVVAFLLDRAEAGDLEAVESLAGTIRREDVAYAGERLRKLCGARTSPSTRASLVALIGGIGDAASGDWLAAVRDDAREDAKLRAAARDALAAIDRAR